MPGFWLGLMLILFFGVYLRVLPVFGYVAPGEDFVQHLRHIVLRRLRWAPPIPRLSWR